MTTQIPSHPVEATLHASNLSWTLHMNREFAQSQSAVWDAITKDELVGKWTPFRPANDLLAIGDVWLAPTDGGEEDLQGRVLEVLPPSSLHYLWVADHLRFELSPTETGTMLMFAHEFDDRNSAASMAAGWHLCLGALEMLLAGKDVPSVIGKNAMKYGWEDLEKQYAALFEAEDDRLEPMDSL